MKSLNELVNIGDVLSERLGKIGLTSKADLEKIGSIQAVLRVDEKDIDTCYNMLYAIEGALRGIRWHAIPKEERQLLKEDFDKAITKKK